MPRIEAFHLLGEIAMGVVMEQAFIVFAIWGFLHLIQLSTFLGWQVLVEGLLFGFLSIFLIEFLDPFES